mgnify:CR=1 FL=1
MYGLKGKSLYGGQHSTLSEQSKIVPRCIADFDNSQEKNEQAITESQPAQLARDIG